MHINYVLSSLTLITNNRPHLNFFLPSFYHLHFIEWNFLDSFRQSHLVEQRVLLYLWLSFILLILLSNWCSIKCSKQFLRQMNSTSNWHIYTCSALFCECLLCVCVCGFRNWLSTRVVHIFDWRQISTKALEICGARATNARKRLCMCSDVIEIKRNCFFLLHLKAATERKWNGQVTVFRHWHNMQKVKSKLTNEWVAPSMYGILI